jgi:hypothetical protein
MVLYNVYVRWNSACLHSTMQRAVEEEERSRRSSLGADEMKMSAIASI